MGEGAEARVDHFAFRVALVVVVTFAQDGGDLVVAAEVDNGEFVRFSGIPGAEEWGEFRRHRGRIGTVGRAWWMSFRGFGGEIARIIFLARLGPRLRDARTAMCGATGDISK